MDDLRGSAGSVAANRTTRKARVRMSLRSFLEELERSGDLTRVARPVSRCLEASGLLKALEDRVVRLDAVTGADFPVAGNVFADRARVARYFGIGPAEMIPRMLHAIENPSRPDVVTEAPCQEVELDGNALGRLPLLFHCEGDGGNYISSGVVVAGHARLGRNLDFHRCMQVGPDKLSVRVVRGRHFDRFLRDQGRMDMAICVGNAPNVLLAAATSVELGRDEMEIANTLDPVRLVKARTSDLLVPADCEFVIECTIDAGETASEGPFVDLTGTRDIVRREPVATVRRITHRRDAVWHALLPGGLEHKLLMGMPREPTIFRAVNEAGVHCLDVHVNPGGCSWLHAVIQIAKEAEEDGRRALAAAFQGHGSLKHAFLVDADVDVLDPLAVEWAMATRFQFDRDVLVVGRQKGSSLDPSAEPESHRTCKVGFDLTKPVSGDGSGAFDRVTYPPVDPADDLD